MRQERGENDRISNQKPRDCTWESQSFLGGAPHVHSSRIARTSQHVPSVHAKVFRCENGKKKTHDSLPRGVFVQGFRPIACIAELHLTLVVHSLILARPFVVWFHPAAARVWQN